MGWFEYGAAFAAFFLSHAVPVRPAVKGMLVKLLGARGFTTLYSILSLAVLSWLISAAAGAPYVEIWAHGLWQHWVPLIVMVPICVIIACTIGRPNPFSFGGARNAQFSTDDPGIVRLTRHPLLMALALWSAAHVVPNGDLAHIVLFGVFCGFAILGMRIIDRRKTRLMGREQWQVLLDRVAQMPLWSASRSLIPRVALGVGLYLGLVVAHPVLFGVSPFGW